MSKEQMDITRPLPPAGAFSVGASTPGFEAVSAGLSHLVLNPFLRGLPVVFDCKKTEKPFCNQLFCVGLIGFFGFEAFPIKFFHSLDCKCGISRFSNQRAMISLIGFKKNLEVPIKSTVNP